MEGYNRSRPRGVAVFVAAVALSLGMAGCAAETFGPGTILTPRGECMKSSHSVELLKGSGELVVGIGDLSIDGTALFPEDSLTVWYDGESDSVVFDGSQESTYGNGPLLTYGDISVELKDGENDDTGDSLFYVDLPESTGDEPHVVTAQEYSEGSDVADKASISIARSESGGAEVTTSIECHEEKKSGNS